MKKPWWRKRSETFNICRNTFEAITTKIFGKKAKETTKVSTGMGVGWTDYGIVIRIYTLSSVYLPYCFTSSHLRNWNNVQTDINDDSRTAWVANCFSCNLYTHVIAFKNHSLAWKFPKFLCSSADVSKLRRKFREKTVLIRNGNCYLGMFQ